MRAIIGYAVAILIVLAICGHAMQVTAKDNRCTASGGQLNWAEECVMP